MAVVVGVSGSLVFEVLLVVSGRVVLPRGGFGLGDAGGVLPEEFVDEGLLLHGVDVHVSDGRPVGDRNLGVGVPPPVGFNSLHVPLVHHSDGVLRLQGEELPEDPLVSLVDEDGLLFGCGLAEQCHEEVDPAAIDGLGEGFAAAAVGGLVEVGVLAVPGGGGVEGEHEGAPEEGVEVEIGLKVEGFDGDGVEINSTEDLLRLVLGCVFESVCDFEAGGEEVEVIGESCVWEVLRMADSKKYLQVTYLALNRRPLRWFLNW